ncbi:MAG TPA: hypothetical protein VMH80_03945 [Bryobacteraceae bacterium]|nr:hypothetical protein [Bryobacteraceae bacterium]
MTTIDLLLSAASGAAASGLLMWLFKEWLTTRLRTSIQHEYDRKLETFKTELKTLQELSVLDIKTAVAREAAFHAAAHNAFAEGQKASMERKLGAVDRLWNSVLQLRAALPPVLTFIDVLTVDEYRGAKDHPTFQALTADLSEQKIAALSAHGVEEVRPYIGEYVWSVFFCYQAILLRILFLLHLGRTDAEKIEWHKDKGTRSLVEAILNKQELQVFDQTQFGKVTWLQRNLEAKILSSAQKVISGEVFGAESLEQAALIQQRISRLSAQTPIFDSD